MGDIVILPEEVAPKRQMAWPQELQHTKRYALPFGSWAQLLRRTLILLLNLASFCQIYN